MTAIKKSQVAEEIPFDNDTNGFDSTDVQGAIEEVGLSASPGFSFGRSSNVNSGTWLQCETVPSNKAGRYVYINDASVVRVFVSNETVGTFDLEVFYHDGDATGLTSLGTVSVVSSRGDEFIVNWAVPTNKQLAIRLVSGSARNIVAGLELQGTT